MAHPFVSRRKLSALDTAQQQKLACSTAYLLNESIRGSYRIASTVR